MKKLLLISILMLISLSVFSQDYTVKVSNIYINGISIPFDRVIKVNFRTTNEYELIYLSVNGNFSQNDKYYVVPNTQSKTYDYVIKRIVNLGTNQTGEIAHTDFDKVRLGDRINIIISTPKSNQIKEITIIGMLE